MSLIWQKYWDELNDMNYFKSKCANNSEKVPVGVGDKYVEKMFEKMNVEILNAVKAVK